MISLIQMGDYKLIDTKTQTNILYLDGECYAWVEAEGIGEILVESHREHKTDALLSEGEYCLYAVENEPHLTDLIHLELEAGFNKWQGYLLPTGLPNNKKTRARIIPTSEHITGNPYVKIPVHKYHEAGSDEVYESPEVALRELHIW